MVIIVINVHKICRCILQYLNRSR